MQGKGTGLGPGAGDAGWRDRQRAWCYYGGATQHSLYPIQCRLNSTGRYYGVRLEIRRSFEASRPRSLRNSGATDSTIAVIANLRPPSRSNYLAWRGRSPDANPSGSNGAQSSLDSRIDFTCELRRSWYGHRRLFSCLPSAPRKSTAGVSPIDMRAC